MIAKPKAVYAVDAYLGKMTKYAGKLYFAGNEEGVMIVDEQTPEKQIFIPTDDFCTDVAILQQLNAFAAINSDGLLNLFDLASNKLLDQIKLDSY